MYEFENPKKINGNSNFQKNAFTSMLHLFDMFQIHFILKI